MLKENERLMGELEKPKQRQREESTRIQADLQLDLNLLMGRLRDETGQQESKIRERSGRIPRRYGRPFMHPRYFYLFLTERVFGVGYDLTVFSYIRCVVGRRQRIRSLLSKAFLHQPIIVG